jgi:hypothetical protein
MRQIERDAQHIMNLFFYQYHVPLGLRINVVASKEAFSPEGAKYSSPW